MNIERLECYHGNYYEGRGGLSAIAVVNHVAMGTLESTAAWFKNPAAGVSATYAIGADGRIVQFVDEADTPFTNGPLRRPNTAAVPWAMKYARSRFGANPVCITIEWEGAHRRGRYELVEWDGRMYSVWTKGGDGELWSPSDAQYAAGLALIADILGRHGLSPLRKVVCRHSDFDSVVKGYCPGLGFPLGKLLADLKPLVK